jgi:hypothetical protein
VNDFIIPLLKLIAPISAALIVFARGLKISASQVATYLKEKIALREATRAITAPCPGQSLR